MEQITIVEDISSLSSWVMKHEGVLLSYFINFIIAVIIFIIGLFISGFVAKTIKRLLVARHIDSSLADFIASLGRYTILGLTLTTALGRVGVQTASVLAVLGFAGLAIGLALQGTFSNLAAGILLVIFRPFNSGEYVDLGGVSGLAVQIQVFSTILQTADGRIIVLPNAKIINGNIINYSRNPVRRNEFIINVADDSDIDMVTRLLSEIILADERILKDKERLIKLDEITPPAMSFLVRFWCSNHDLRNVYWDVLALIKRRFDENGIHFQNSKTMEINYRRPRILKVIAPHTVKNSSKTIGNKIY